MKTRGQVYDENFRQLIDDARNAFIDGHITIQELIEEIADIQARFDVLWEGVKNED